MAQEKTPLDLLNTMISGMFNIAKAMWQKGVVEPRRRQKELDAERKAMMKADMLNAQEEARKAVAEAKAQGFSASREKTLGTSPAGVRSQGVPQSSAGDKKASTAIDPEALKDLKGIGSSPSTVKQKEAKGTVSQNETVKHKGVKLDRTAVEELEAAAQSDKPQTAAKDAKKAEIEKGVAKRKEDKKKSLAAKEEADSLGPAPMGG